MEILIYFIVLELMMKLKRKFVNILALSLSVLHLVLIFLLVMNGKVVKHLTDNYYIKQIQTKFSTHIKK